LARVVRRGSANRGSIVVWGDRAGQEQQRERANLAHSEFPIQNVALRILDTEACELLEAFIAVESDGHERETTA
jgi:hypothetical protein